MTGKKSGKTVLVIEDGKDIRQFAVTVLRLEGYQTLEAPDAEAGLQLFREQPVDLVLLDLRLPGRDGWWLLSEKKRIPGKGEVPVIVFTASADPQHRKRATETGAADYLVKPVSAGMLRDAVASILPAE
ncbi:response regulator [Chloroflexota bacterium]